ncbi:MAG: SCO family protein, partial [Methylohalobius sp.]|nr:SCO family protein [Methylohalobius sp.]
MKVLLLLLVLLTSCSQPAWHAVDVGGKLPPLDFSLTDTHGNLKRGEDFRGRITLLFTGFTHCPGVCPATLARLATALEGIEGSQEHIQVLFVSLDPQRDTPEVLERYVRRFGPWFVGLTGTQAQLEEVTKRYFLVYQKAPSMSQGEYEILHSSQVLVFDRQGR